MGWSDCGDDSRGRPIGYAFEATCDEPGCTARIDRGLAYACGGEHGATERCCEGYFCYAHLLHVQPKGEERGFFACPSCCAGIETDEEE